MSTRADRLAHQFNDINNDLRLLAGRHAEALDLLDVWATEHPGTDLARMSRHLIARCQEPS